MPHHTVAGISPTINVLPPYHHQWTGQATFKQNGQRPRKIFCNRFQRGVLKPAQFSHSPNIKYQHLAPPYNNQPMGGRGGRGRRHQGRNEGTGNMQANHTNNIKRFHNLNYCFTCGYDVDQPGNSYPVADPAYHMLNVPRDEAHMYANQGAIMVSQHKSLLDVTVAGMRWISANSIIKTQFVMHCQQEFARIRQNHQPYQHHKPKQKHYCGRGNNTHQQ